MHPKDNSRKRQIYQAIHMLNGCQSYFNFKLEETEDVDICNGAHLDWDEFCEKHSCERISHVIYITEKPFSDNWFSHESSSFAVITTHDWEKYYSPPSLKAYVVYQTVQAALSFEADFEESMELNMVHDRPRGCMFDFCQDKDDIKLGMIAGSICPECRVVLQRYGVCADALDAIERTLYHVRAEAIGKPIIFNNNQAFVVMRFTEHDENDNAYQYGIIPALNNLNIKCLRADNRTRSAQLLDQIRTDISKSRFVVAKVDEDNLNVYFELGLAMGMEKDVLLISEKDLIIKLPTDLKNWECLTYPKGDYKTLQGKIEQFFKYNYHY